MNRITKLLTGTLSSVLLTLAPAHARIEDETGDLIRLLQSNGINVVINGERCDGTVHGSYQFLGLRRQLNLCPGESIDAKDHETVRHEAIHVLQHCFNASRGTSVTTPIMDLDTLVEAVNSNLPADVVAFIKSAYPEDQWAIEMEANLMAREATLVQIMGWFTKACTY